MELKKILEELVKYLPKEDVMVASFANGLHQIYRTPQGEFYCKYNVSDNKIPTITDKVKALPVALDNLKRKFPDVEQDVTEE